MEGFTLSLALVDAVPVLFFGASMILIATKFSSFPFVIGAALITLAGCCKVAWKLILGIWKKNIFWLNKLFLPMQVTGFLFVLLSFLIGFRKIHWNSVLMAATRFPCIIFLGLWIILMVTMGWYRSSKFDNSARANWIAQTLNCIGQIALFFGVLLIF